MLQSPIILKNVIFFVENLIFFDIFRFFNLFYSIWVMLGARDEYLTMRKVISGRKRYSNNNNQEKNDFFEKIFFGRFGLNLWVVKSRFS